MLGPDGTPATLSVSFSFTEASNPLSVAFDKADNLRVHVLVEELSPVERVFELTPGQEVIRARIELTLPSAEASAAVTAELRRGSDALFHASEILVIRAGAPHELTMTIAPVPSRLLVPGSIVVDVLGQPVQLEGAVGFASGDPIPGVPVSWSTDATGIQVTPDGILVAERNGVYPVTAEGGPFSAVVPVEVSAAPTSVGFVSEPAESAFPGEPVPGSPAVRVMHQDIPMPGVEVVFSADPGGEVSDPVVVTDDEGIAVLAVWILGDDGVNTLTAAVDGAPPAELTMATLDPCTRALPLALGVTVTGELIPRRSCQAAVGLDLERAGIAGRLLEAWRIVIPDGVVLRGSLTAANFRPLLFSHLDPGLIRIHGLGVASPGTVTQEFVVPGGAYWLSASSVEFDADDPPGGPYSLSTVTVSEPQVGCLAGTVVTFGSVAQGRITEEDCGPDSGDGSGPIHRLDRYAALLQGGQSMTATVVADFRYRFHRLVGAGAEFEFVEGFDDVPAGESRTLTATAAEPMFHVFIIQAELADGAGDYTLSIGAGPGGGPAPSSDVPSLLRPPTAHSIWLHR